MRLGVGQLSLDAGDIGRTGEVSGHVDRGSEHIQNPVEPDNERDPRGRLRSQTQRIQYDERRDERTTRDTDAGHGRGRGGHEDGDQVLNAKREAGPLDNEHRRDALVERRTVHIQRRTGGNYKARDTVRYSQLSLHDIHTHRQRGV